MENRNILIVDDDDSNLVALEFIFRKQQLNLFTAKSGKEALPILKNEKIDLVLTDFMMPDIDGFELLKIVKNIDDSILVIIMTAYDSTEKVIKAFKEGVSDFIVKPFDKLAIIQAVNKALEKKELIRENTDLKAKLSILSSQKIIGQAKQFKKIISDIKNIIAQTSSTVMIYGESGTGKEVIARYIHESSNRSKKAFITVNISSLPESLIESELFGYKKGAFTGAIKDKKGYFEVADKGTLFLDEIGELPLGVQVKILRFIQEGEIIPVGEVEAIKVDVRIITATNKKLDKLIELGKFREDLYYRLNIIPIDLPPLRKREDDIPLLIKYFLEKFSIKHNRSNLNITDDAITLLSEYNWPGNVRELENVVERLVIYNKELISEKSIPLDISNKVKNNESNYIKIKIGTTTIEEVKDLMIEKTLKFTNGDKKLAVKILGISLKTLYRKI